MQVNGPPHAKRPLMCYSDTDFLRVVRFAVLVSSTAPAALISPATGAFMAAELNRTLFVPLGVQPPSFSASTEKG